jgi:hypothetical protein
MLLFVDIEASGLIQRDLPLGDPAQPWVVEMAAELVGLDGVRKAGFVDQIKAEGRQVAEGRAITSRQWEDGSSEVAVLGHLCQLAARATYLVGHGIAFDRTVVESLLIARGKDTRLWVRPGLESRCTMRAATPFCRMPHVEPKERGGFRWPSLDEAAEILCGLPPGPRSAESDLAKTKAVYFELDGCGAFGPAVADEMSAHEIAIHRDVEQRTITKIGRVTARLGSLSTEELAIVHARAAVDHLGGRRPEATRRNIEDFCTHLRANLTLLESKAA